MVRPEVARPSVTGTIALMLACAAVGFALLAAPGGVAWVPWIDLPDRVSVSGFFSLVAIPAAVVSWLLALGGVVVAVIAVVQRRGGHRSVVALALCTPGAVLGTVVVGALAVQFGVIVGVFPDGADIARQRDARAIAAHLALPTAGARLIGQCEDREGVFGEARTLAIVEPWSQARVDQIKDRLQTYTPVTSYGPSSPTDQSKINFQGIDPRGNSVSVHVERFPAGTTRTLLCTTVKPTAEVMRTTIYVTAR